MKDLSVLGNKWLGDWLVKFSMQFFRGVPASQNLRFKEISHISGSSGMRNLKSTCQGCIAFVSPDFVILANYLFLCSHISQFPQSMEDGNFCKYKLGFVFPQKMQWIVNIESCKYVFVFVNVKMCTLWAVVLLSCRALCCY